MKHKISFLLPAHNEGKIIAKTLANLMNLSYDNYEVIIGLDGCTDDTENIVKTCDLLYPGKLRYFKLNLRQGKPAVINSIIKHATGDIIIINDADWIFRVESQEAIERFLSTFDDPSVGGICENNALEFEEIRLRTGNLGFKMVAYSSQLWYEYQKKEFTSTEGNMGYLNEPAMFLTNVFRKTLFKPNESLGDDFERTNDILDTGKKIVIPLDEDSPRFIPVYDSISIKDLFKLKIRTAIAREQVQSKRPLPKYYYPKAVWYILSRSWKYGIGVGLMMIFWIALTTCATFIGKFKYKRGVSTKEGWKLRVKR